LASPLAPVYKDLLIAWGQFEYLQALSQSQPHGLEKPQNPRRSFIFFDVSKIFPQSRSVESIEA
jgi:hypothetical protein